MSALPTELVGEFIDAAVRDHARAAELLTAHPDLINARWLHGETALHFLPSKDSSGGTASGGGRSSRAGLSGVEAMRDRPKAKTIDEYLAGLSDDKRHALERLRVTIRAAAPGAEEYISYSLPAFRLDGKPLVAFGATAKHCAFYPMSGTMVDAYKEELENYDTSKGTIRFPAAKPLPAALVRKLVKARIAENAASRSGMRRAGGRRA